MTDETKYRLLAAFRRLDQRIDMSNFDARLVFQKSVYLLQELGFQLGYTFGWYIRGPYSRGAADGGFQLEPIQDDVEHLPEISNSESEIIERFKDLMLEAKKEFQDKNEAYIAEMLGSLHFLQKYGYPRPTSSSEALRKFLELKPEFGRDAETALDLLRRYGLS